MKILKNYWVLLFCFVIACQPISKENEVKTGPPKIISENEDSVELIGIEIPEGEYDSAEITEDSMIIVPPTQSQVDTHATAVSKFIAGMWTEEFNNLQNTNFYKKHVSIVSQSWKKTQKEDLNPISEWVAEKNIFEHQDRQATVFYPFSGPDILYVNAFFPYAKNYVMVGLEKTGTMPDIPNTPQSLLAGYLESIRYSLRYINKVGYFVTKQMSSDLSKRNLDGTLHIMLYYLARTNHKIIDVENIYIDSQGNITTIVSPVQGVKVEFTDADNYYPQQLYYFPLDLSNENMESRPGFLKYLNSLDRMITYVKSGSYILHDAYFSKLRNTILAQSDKILQDDTGIPYWLFQKYKYDLTLYGNYSKTIKVFRNHFQPDLKAALDNQVGDYSLPFKIGYNAWYNETILMYAKALSDKQYAEKQKTKKPEKPSDISEYKPDQVVFKVQIKTSSQQLSPNDFNGLTNVDHYFVNGVYKYTIGNEKSPSGKIKQLKQLAKQKGYNDAFTVAFYNGVRIPVPEAVKIINQ